MWDLYCEAGAWSVDGLASAADIYCYSAPTTASTGGYTELSTYWPTQESTSSSATSSTTTTTEPSPVSTTTTSSSPPLTTSSPDPDCDALCEDVEDAFLNLSDGCCTPKYCMCASGMGYSMTCPDEGSLFCPEEQACVYGCLENPECCDADTTSTAPGPSSTACDDTFPPDQHCPDLGIDNYEDTADCSLYWHCEDGCVTHEKVSGG